MGSTKRWKLMPPAFAAVSSECRPSVPTVNTVATSTAAGMISNIFSGSRYT